MARFVPEPKGLDRFIETSDELHLAVVKKANEILDVADLPGRGTRGGSIPAGGAPVWSGKLIVSGKVTSTPEGAEVSYESDYVGYVYFGSKHNVPPNAFLNRAVDEVAAQAKTQ